MKPSALPQAVGAPAWWLGSGAAQGGGLVLAWLLLVAYGWRDDGLWFIGDAPRHLMTGLFMADLLRAWPDDPLGFALAFYARYPLIVPLAYPPLFHLLEGLLLLWLPPGPWVGKGLVLVSAVVLGGYTCLWGRRWLAPMAGWAGALLLVTPGLLWYGNAVLLNVPAAALGLAMLYHLRRWLDHGGRHHLVAAVGLAIASLLTYYPAVLGLLLAAAWTRSPWRRPQLVSLLLPLVLATGLAFLLSLQVPAHLLRNLPSLARLGELQTWLHDPVALANLASGPLAALAVLGIAMGLRNRHWCAETRQLLAALLLALGGLLLLPAKDERYVLPALPLLVLAACIGPAIWLSALASRQRAGLVAVAAGMVLLAWAGFNGLRPGTIGGHDAAAHHLVAADADATVLYAGRQDGNFGVYLRLADPARRTRLVLADRLLAQSEAGPGFERRHRALADTPDAVLERIRTACGCRWVAWEVRADSDLDPAERQLRLALESPHFERVASFVLRSPGSPRLDLFRTRFEPVPITAVDLRFPFFTDRIFRGVRPLEPLAR